MTGLHLLILAAAVAVVLMAGGIRGHLRDLGGDRG